MSEFGLVFPGQGAHFEGMGKALYNEFGLARETYEEASEVTKLDLANICFENHDNLLERTEYAQPCILTTSLAAWRVLQDETGIRPSWCAGHSLGEYTALAAAGALSVADAAMAVRMRGKWMEEEAPDGAGGMAAVLKTSLEAIEAACKEAARDQVVVPANDNSPDQVVISGHAEALDRAIAVIKKNGGRARKLKVSGPFHTELMAPAAERMEELIFGLKISGFSFPVIANVDAKAYPGPEAVPDRLTRQMTRAVRWRETVCEMERQGVRLYVETGPGQVLSGLIKKTAPRSVVLSMLEPGHVGEIERVVSYERRR
jgi:[acyl-carrier-protein] S-malonyltransferase